MKKQLLFAIVFTLVAGAVWAQCTPGGALPGANLADSTFGAWPDTIQNFPPADVGVYYQEDLNFKVPSDGGDVDPTFTGVSIDSFQVVDVVGLPSCLTYVCNQSSCSWLGGEVGCAQISGTCNTTGSYDVTIETLGWTTVIGALSVPYDFVGYRIDVNGTTGLMEVKEQDFYITQNSPNPFRGITEITYYTKENKAVQLEVYDLVGKKVVSEQYFPAYGKNTIQFDSRNLQGGVYLYTLIQGDKAVTKKMTIAGE